MAVDTSEDMIFRLVMNSTCVYMYHMLGLVIFFGGQMAMAIGEDLIFRSAVKSTCVYMCHLSSSVIFFGGQMARWWFGRLGGQLVTQEVSWPDGGSGGWVASWWFGRLGGQLVVVVKLFSGGGGQVGQWWWWPLRVWLVVDTSGKLVVMDTSGRVGGGHFGSGWWWWILRVRLVGVDTSVMTSHC